MITLCCAWTRTYRGFPRRCARGVATRSFHLNRTTRKPMCHDGAWDTRHATRRFCRNSEPLRTEPERACRLLSRCSLGCCDPHRPVTERSHRACWVLPRKVRRDMPGQNPRPATEPALWRHPVSSCDTGMACQAPCPSCRGVCHGMCVAPCTQACRCLRYHIHVDIYQIL